MIETPNEILSHHASRDSADSFCAWRKKLRKPLTERAACMIAASLALIRKAGGDASEALDLAQEHGWQTIKPDWYWKVKNGNGHRNSTAPADTAAREIAFAARAARSPDPDWL